MGAVVTTERGLGLGNLQFWYTTDNRQVKNQCLEKDHKEQEEKKMDQDTGIQLTENAKVLSHITEHLMKGKHVKKAFFVRKQR